MKRSKHSLSYTQLLTGKMGTLIPCGLFEVLPGDTFQHAASLLVRCAPLNAPVMHPIHVRVHHWFVPYRILWSNWEDFITGDPNGTSPVFPYITLLGGVATGLGSLSDYFGIAPVSVGHSLQVSALPYRAYNMIWNEWYRDQDLNGVIPNVTTDGVDNTSNILTLFACWEKDYFTTCRPWTQKGPAVSVPIGGVAPVTGIGKISQNFSAVSTNAYESDGTVHTYSDVKTIDPSSSDTQFVVEGSGTSGAYPQIFANLALATGTSVNALRQALAIQRYEEARARYGSRYTEYLRYLGVRSSDARLQRPEYLGGGKQTIQFSEVLQTAPTTSGTPGTGLGAFGGHGIGATRSNRYRRFFEEHGVVLSLLSVIPKTIYASGAPRLFFRSAVTDFWQKELEHIGQQEVYNAEIFTDIGSSTTGPNSGLFGYQDRYDEYRRQESQVSGEFRTTFNYWHDARIFSTIPVLNGVFVSSQPSTRIFQDTTDDNLYVMVMHSCQARRLVAKIGTSSIF